MKLIKIKNSQNKIVSGKKTLPTGLFRKTKTIHDERYAAFISDMVAIRHRLNMPQRTFAMQSGYSECFVARTETRERRLDLIETIDYMKNLGLTRAEIIRRISELI